jgi:N-acyl-D-aspartate/D-glutamate deacylase
MQGKRLHGFRRASAAPTGGRARFGGRRLVQRVDGYKATLVAGIPVFEDGEDTGARPGRLVRAGR